MFRSAFLYVASISSLFAHTTQASSFEGDLRDNLLRVANAIQAYYHAHQKMPTDILDAKGTPILSWRVAILPFLGQLDLYKQFCLEEPWDSPHNLPLLRKRPDDLRNPFFAGEKDNDTLAAVAMPRGPGTWVDFPPHPEFVPLPSPETILLVLLSEEQAVPWSKPGDWQFDAEAPLGGLFCWRGDSGSRVAFGDCKLNDIHAEVKPALMVQLVSGRGLEGMKVAISPWETLQTIHGWYRLGPPLCFGVICIAWGLATVVSMARTQTIVSAEIVVVTLAAHQILFWPLYLFNVEYPPQISPVFFGCHLSYYSQIPAPLLAAAASAYIFVLVYWNRRAECLWLFGWMWLTFWAVNAASGRTFHSYDYADQSLAASLAPGWLALAVLILAGITFFAEKNHEKNSKRQWTAIGFCLLPLIYYSLRLAF